MIMSHPKPRLQIFWHQNIDQRCGNAETMAISAQNSGWIEGFYRYGMSKTCPVLKLAHLDSADHKLLYRGTGSHSCKTGQPLPFAVDLRIMDPRCRMLHMMVKRTGEVVVRALNLI